MTALLEFKQKIKGIYAQYEMYLLPLLKFVLALVYFIWINTNMGYMTALDNIFVVLIFISFIISLFKFIPALEQKFKKSAKTEIVNEKPTAALKTEMPEVSEDVTEDTELAAVIAAAIAASEGTSADGFIVRSIKRRKSNKWN